MVYACVQMCFIVESEVAMEALERRVEVLRKEGVTVQFDYCYLHPKYRILESDDAEACIGSAPPPDDITHPQYVCSQGSLQSS